MAMSLDVNPTVIATFMFDCFVSCLIVFCLFFTTLRRKNGEHYCMPKRFVLFCNNHLTSDFSWHCWVDNYNGRKKCTASNVTEDMLACRTPGSWPQTCLGSDGKLKGLKHVQAKLIWSQIFVFCFWPDTAPLSIVHHYMTFIVLLLHLLVCDQNFTG